MAETFEKARLMAFGGNAVTDHNRQPVQVGFAPIEKKQRMANGTLRKYFVAEKREWSTSWNELPQDARFTVDGHWGADELETFYRNTKGPFTLELVFANSATETYTVMIKSFDKTLNKRGRYNFYDVSIALEEV